MRLPCAVIVLIMVTPMFAQRNSLDREILRAVIDHAQKSASAVNAVDQAAAKKKVEAAEARASAANKKLLDLKTGPQPPNAFDVSAALTEFTAANAGVNAARRELERLERLDGRMAINPTDNPLLYTLFFAAKFSAQDLVAQIEILRTDKQAGAPPAGTGSTSLVSRGSVPAVLGLAVESGALTQSTNETSVTFRGNLVGLFDLLRRNSFIGSYAESGAATQFLRRFSYSISFGPARELPEGSEIRSTLTFTGSTRQVAGFSARVDLLNTRDPRRKAVREIWQRFSEGEARQLNGALNSVFQPVFASEEYARLIENKFPDVQTATRDQVESAALAFAEEFWLLSRKLNPDLEQRVRQAVRAAVDYANKREQILEEISRLPVIAFEYFQERPIAGPSLSKLNLIADAQIFHGRGSIAANGGVTLFNSRKGMTAAGSTTVPGITRDAYASVDLTLGLGAFTGTALQTGNVTLSFAGKYERIFDGAFYSQRLGEIGPATITLPGNLGIMQAKLTIPIKGTGLKIPISLSYANRTELIQEKDVSGQFGLTFDFDQLVNQLKGVVLPGLLSQ
jgi:hypothetical protein